MVSNLLVGLVIPLLECSTVTLHLQLRLCTKAIIHKTMPMLTDQAHMNRRCLIVHKNTVLQHIDPTIQQHIRSPLVGSANSRRIVQCSLKIQTRDMLKTLHQCHRKLQSLVLHTLNKHFIVFLWNQQYHLQYLRKLILQLIHIHAHTRARSVQQRYLLIFGIKTLRRRRLLHLRRSTETRQQRRFTPLYRTSHDLLH